VDRQEDAGMTPTEEVRAFVLRRLQEDAGELATAVRHIPIDPCEPVEPLAHAIALADRVAEWVERVQQLEGRE
jgi:hypothetical protein